MKKIKYLFFAIFIICGFLLSGELYQDYLNSFANLCDYTTLYAESYINNDEMLEDLTNAADKNNVNFFVTESGNTSLYSAYTNIYCSSEGAEQYINDSLGVYEGTAKSIFLGSNKVTFKDVKDITNLKKQTYFYLIGDSENQTEFKAELMEKYGGSLPREGLEYHSTYRDFIVVWFILFAFCLVLSLYQILSSKKEALIKVMYGESLKQIILKNILTDTLVYLVCFGLIYFIMSLFCYTNYHLGIVLIMLAIMIVINIILNLLLLRLNIKRDLSRSSHSKNTLILNYVFKLILTIVTLCVITSNISVIANGLSYYSQKDFFEEHSDYYYVYTCIDTAEYSEEIDLANGKYEYGFYQYFTGRGKAITQVDFDTLETEDKEYEIIYINKNNLDYLFDCVPELSRADFTEDKVYYIFPESFKNSENFDFYFDDFDDWVRFFFEVDRNNQYNYMVKSYENNIKMLEISEDFTYKSDYIKNPIIVYNNIDESKDNYEITSWQRNLYCNDIMYQIDDNSIAEIEKAAGYSHNELYYEIENVYDLFQENMEYIKRLIYMNAIIAVIVLALDIAITTMTLSLEYSVNKIEHAVRKTLGYSRFERLKSLYLVSIITSSVGTVIFAIINLILNFTKLSVIPICGIIVILLDIAVITIYSGKKEKDNVNKVLKGG